MSLSNSNIWFTTWFVEKSLQDKALLQAKNEDAAKTWDKPLNQVGGRV